MCPANILECQEFDMNLPSRFQRVFRIGVYVILATILSQFDCPAIRAQQSTELPKTADGLTNENRIRNILNQQVVAWNAGKIDDFMKAYWRSPKLSFCSGGKLTRGWQETLDGYKSRYPDRQTMGKLSFSDLEITQLAEPVALVLGKWHLERKSPGKPIGGNFTLVFQRIEDRWLIIHDHTSVLKLEQ